jgi:hypothetical protein
LTHKNGGSGAQLGIADLNAEKNKINNSAQVDSRSAEQLMILLKSSRGNMPSRKYIVPPVNRPRTHFLRVFVMCPYFFAFGKVEVLPRNMVFAYIKRPPENIFGAAGRNFFPRRFAPAGGGWSDPLPPSNCSLLLRPVRRPSYT